MGLFQKLGLIEEIPKPDILSVDFATDSMQNSSGDSLVASESNVDVSIIDYSSVVSDIYKADGLGASTTLSNM